MPAIIENPDAYHAAVGRRIREGAYGKWLKTIGDDNVRAIEIAVSKRRHTPGFWADMAASIEEYGRLTENQSAAILAILTKQEIDAQARQEADKATSGHVGTIGCRDTFAAVCTFETNYTTNYGTTYIYGMKDVQGNVIIVKGTRPIDFIRGENYQFTAFVKEHGEREGVKQTIVNRVKVTK